jgi:DNA-binding CsgD family transcriptional regulator
VSRDWADAVLMPVDEPPQAGLECVCRFAIDRELGDMSSVARRLRSPAVVETSDGDRRSAASFAEESDRIGGEGDEPARLWARIHAGWARFGAGDVSAGTERMREALAGGRAVGIATVTAHALVGLACAAAIAEDAVSQCAYLAEALTESERAGGDVEEVAGLSLAAGLAANKGRFDSALRVTGRASTQSRRHRGRTHTRFVVPLRPVIDRARQAVGPQTAERLEAEGSGMAWNELTAEALAEPGSDVEHLLSAREREVAGLVGRGMTNGEIAAQLFISKRTVETHIDHIKQKLKAGSRSEMIAWALRETLDSPETSSESDPGAVSIAR